ncbi:MAG: hypothetical protein AAFR42_21075 [Cyanobacteria bacterium J06628_6]
MPIYGAQSWRGLDGEGEMTEADWLQRAEEQALAMREGGSWENANPDEDSDPTAGCYEGDYPQDVHDALNQRLQTDEHYEAEVDRDLRTLFRGDAARREAESNDA